MPRSSRRQKAQINIGNRQSAIGNSFEPPYLGCYRILGFLVTLLFAGALYASDVSTDFASANRLYAEGKFAGAASDYDKILQTGRQSPALLFDYANAEYKSGHLGLAIAAYQKAARLAPRDDDIRANLQFVRNQVKGPTVHESRWQSWVGVLTLNEGALLTAFLFWFTCALFTVRQFRPALVPRLKTATRMLVVLTIFSASVLGLQAANHFSAQTAVVITDDVTVRSGPFDEAQSAFTAHDGAELSVLDRHGDWFQVADGSGQTGWLPAKQAEVLPGS